MGAPARNGTPVPDAAPDLERASTAPPLVLASASPRRAEILRRLGLAFTVDPSHVPETGEEGETAEAYARRLSREKAAEVLGRHPGALVLAGDTVVVLDGEILGKPGSEGEAVEMLLRLEGRTHTVFSGLALGLPGGEILTGVLGTRVTFRSFHESFARRYVETGEPMDKAGAYGIQGQGSALVKEIQGDYQTVVGLPLPLFLDLLEEAGWHFEFGRLIPREEATP